MNTVTINTSKERDLRHAKTMWNWSREKIATCETRITLYKELLQGVVHSTHDADRALAADYQSAIRTWEDRQKHWQDASLIDSRNFYEIKLDLSELKTAV